MVSRRPVKDPPEKGTGGWNLFHTWGGGLAMNSPLTNTPTPTPCDQSNWFGWPCDEELENIRLEFFTAATPEEQKAVVDRLQARFYEVVPYLPVGPVPGADRLSQQPQRRARHGAPGALEHREELSGFSRRARIGTGERAAAAALGGRFARGASAAGADRLAGELVGALVVGVAAVALDPAPVDPVRGRARARAAATGPGS